MMEDAQDQTFYGADDASPNLEADKVGGWN